MPRRIPLSELILSMPYPSRTARWNWRDDLRDVRCKMEDVRGLTGVGSLVFIKNLRIGEFIRNYDNYGITQ